MANTLLDELDLALPGVTVALPTKGIFYEPGILAPNTNVDDIVVNTLSMIDEIKYRDPLLQASGKAVHDIIRRICPEILKPELLCDVDLEAILIGSRIASYSSTLPLQHVCENPAMEEEIDPKTQEPTGNVFPVCRNEVDRLIDLEEFMWQYAPQDFSNYSVFLEKYGQTVFLKPISHVTSLGMTKMLMERQRDFNEFNKENVESEILNDEAMFGRYTKLVDITYQLSNDIILDSIWYVVTKSGTIERDRNAIAMWLKKLPDKKAINAKISELTEHIRNMSSIHYDCEVCGYKNSVPIVLDADKLFLEQSTVSKVPTKSSSISNGNEPIMKKRSRNLPRSPIITGVSPTTV